VSEKKLTTRQKQAMESRRKLVDSATELFNRNGYQQTGVQDICAHAGLSVGVFYHYFPSKQELLQAILRSKNEELMELIANESRAQTHLEALLEIFGFICRQKMTGSVELICSSFAPSPAGGAVPDEKLVELISSVVRSAQEAGELTKDLPAERIAVDLLIAERGFQLYWCESGGGFDVQEGQREYLKRLLRGYLGPCGVIEGGKEEKP